MHYYSVVISLENAVERSYIEDCQPRSSRPSTENTYDAISKMEICIWSCFYENVQDKTFNFEALVL